MDVGTLELVELESLLYDSPICESEHLDGRNRECSGEVVARTSFCKRTLLGCANHAAFYQYGILFGKCGGCGRPCADCWSVVPV